MMAASAGIALGVNSDITSEVGAKIGALNNVLGQTVVRHAAAHKTQELLLLSD